MRASLIVSLAAASLSILAAAEPVDNWAPYPLPAGAAALNTVVFGNGVFVAAGRQGTLITSTNGADWTPQASGATDDFWRLKFVNGLFFATSSRTYISSNAVAWVPLTGLEAIRDITFGKRRAEQKNRF
jgi:hypothetical protein